jgi:ABC-type multidrug transport system fused ATPase/permease subunit
MLKELIALLSKSEKIIFGCIAMARFLLVALDLGGLLLVGLVATELSGNPIPKISILIDFLNFTSKLGFENSYATLGALAALFFLMKAIFSIFLNQFQNSQLAGLEARTASRLFGEYFTRPLDLQDEYSESEIVHTLNPSVSAATTLLLGGYMQILSESALLAIISGYLMFLNPVLFVLVAFFVGVTAGTLSFLIGRRAKRLAKQMNDSSLKSNETMFVALNNRRQIFTAGRSHEFTQRFESHRENLAARTASYHAVTTLPRYLAEIIILIGVGTLVFQRSINPEAVSASVLTVFLAGIFRMVAAVLPLQTSYAALPRVKADAKHAFTLMKRLGNALQHPALQVEISTSPEIQANAVTYDYPDGTRALRSLNCVIPFGSYVAISGKSGAGKSTFADLVSGMRNPTSGAITVNGVDIRQAVMTDPYLVAYVPQATNLFEGTIAQNVAMAFDDELIDPVKVEAAIDQVQLRSLIDSLSAGIHENIGLGFRGLSGGQKQRIGLARAMYQNAKIVILDEATSALDLETETEISKVLTNLRGTRTFIVIAHRPKSIANVDFQIEL